MSEYIHSDEYDICIELNNKEKYYVIGKATPILREGCGKEIAISKPLYSFEELDRLGLKATEIPWIDMPYGDMTLSMNGGFVTFKKGNDIVFMVRRNLIKNCVTTFNGMRIE